MTAGTWTRTSTATIAILYGLWFPGGCAVGPEVGTPSAAVERATDSANEPDSPAFATGESRPEGSAASPPAAAPAPPATGRIAGTVHYRGPGSYPAPFVHVYLWRNHEERRVLAGETRTNGEGRFVFDRVRVGVHSFSTWTAEGEGWEYFRDPVTIEGGKTTDVPIRVNRPLAPEARIRVTGTVTYDDGRPVGSFRFQLHSEPLSYVVEGKEGRFECTVRRSGKYVVSMVEADGERRENRTSRILVLRGEPVSLVLDVPRDVVLVVVDQETGEPLPTARAYRREWEDDDFLFDNFPNPRTLAGAPVSADGEGRIPLGKVTGSTTWFVVADGHAWGMVATTRGAAETRIALEAGGTVHLSVEGWAGLADARVSAAASEPPWRTWELTGPAPDGNGVYEGIPAGTWEFKVRRGWFHERGEVYGAGSVEVHSGKASTLSLPTRPSSAGTSVPVSGTVTVPPAWGLLKTRLFFNGAESVNSSVRRTLSLELPADGTPAPFQLDPLPPGRYEIKVDPQWYTEVIVPPAGESFDFVLPDPGTVLVRVLDDATGAPLDEANVGWHTDAGRTGYGVESAERTDAAGEFRIVAPAGRVAISASAPGHVSMSLGGLGGNGETQSVVVRAGNETSVTIRLRRAGAVQINFRWDGEAPNWQDASVAIVEDRNDIYGRAYFVNVKDGRGTRVGFEPGPYRVTVDSIERLYENVPDIPIEVRAGETTEVNVSLVRKR